MLKIGELGNKKMLEIGEDTRILRNGKKDTEVEEQKRGGGLQICSQNTKWRLSPRIDCD
jgi:hypothetical protein